MNVLKMCFASCILSVALPVYATTFRIAPVSAHAVVGENVSVAVSVGAGDEKIVTAKLAVEYPANLLEFVSFAPSTQWMPLSAVGYDSVQSGGVVKTAGFPGGFTGEKEFGKLLFRAKGAGSANVSITASNSLLLNSQGVNKLDGVGGTVVLISSASAPVEKIKSGSSLIEPFSELKAKGAATTTAEELIATTSEQEAAVAKSGLASISAKWWAIIILVVGIAAAIIWRVLANKKESEF